VDAHADGIGPAAAGSRFPMTNMVCTFIYWLLRTYGSLVHYNFMAGDDLILAALELKASGAERHGPFQVSDIVLAAQRLPEALIPSIS
jgi:hypothetical protein